MAAALKKIQEILSAKVADEVKKHYGVAGNKLDRGAKKWIYVACERPITGSATKLRAHHLISSFSGLP